jgi:hypothetical protein
MRIRIDGLETLLTQEARLALRVAGLIVVEGTDDADYVVTLTEDVNPRTPVTLRSSDGPLERLAINKVTAFRSSLLLERAEVPNDRVLAITIPAVDHLRRLTSRALVEIFLTYVSQPVVRRHEPPVLLPVGQAEILASLRADLLAELRQAAREEPSRPWWQRLWSVT